MNAQADGVERCFDVPANRGILLYILGKQPSAHGDLVEEMLRAAGGIEDVRVYCPDRRRYAYTVLYTADGVIFAAAFGMFSVLFRLPSDLVSEARVAGGESWLGIGEEWVAFNPFRAGQRLAETREAMQAWCEAAHRYAKSLGERTC